MLVERAIEKLSPISQEMTRLMKDTSEIDRVLAKGADKARAIAAPVLKETYEIVGILQP
jgi:tryptophanyl-tRNA synthetase